MPKGSSGDGSTSVCANPTYSPIHYHWYPGASGARLVDEVRALATAAGVPKYDVDRLVGEFRARGRALRAGRLEPIRHVKGPMATVTDIDVFEIRASVEFGPAGEIHVRAYHVEPRTLRQKGGSTVVGVHVHVKDLSDPKTVKARQNAELQIARGRYHSGRGSNWGGAALTPTV